MRDAGAEGIRRMWQEQPREEHIMSTSEIRVKAALFDDRVRRNNAGAAVAFAVILIGNIVQVLMRGQQSYERAGAALTVMAAASMLWLYWRARSTAVRLDESGLSCMAFYRAQLVRQRKLAGRFWICVLAFIPGNAAEPDGRDRGTTADALASGRPHDSRCTGHRRRRVDDCARDAPAAGGARRARCVRLELSRRSDPDSALWLGINWPGATMLAG